jgi:hypothetical protein
LINQINKPDEDHIQFTAEIAANDGSAHFRAPLKELFNAIPFKPPEVGQRVKPKGARPRGRLRPDPDLFRRFVGRVDDL